MPSKRTRLLLTLMASVGVPYFWFNENWSKWLSTAPKHAVQSSSPFASSAVSVRSAPSPSQSASTSIPESSPSSGMMELADVLRLDITPQWVVSHWPRVSTVRSEQNLDGMRVPYVSGTSLADIAGSLTYYFDRTDQVQRISLQGKTGDERKIVTLVTNTFGLHAEPSLGAGMYIARWNAIPTSVLRITYSPVIRNDRPHDRLHVVLEINRPGAYFGLSRDFQQLLLHDHGANRW